MSYKVKTVSSDSRWTDVKFWFVFNCNILFLYIFFNIIMYKYEY